MGGYSHESPEAQVGKKFVQGSVMLLESGGVRLLSAPCPSTTLSTSSICSLDKRVDQAIHSWIVRWRSGLRKASQETDYGHFHKLLLVRHSGTHLSCHHGRLRQEDSYKSEVSLVHIVNVRPVWAIK